MNLYTQSQTDSFHEETFAFLEIKENDNVLTITLDRANKKNALHPQMVNEIAYAFQYAHFEKSIWTIVLQANGNIFCAGGDLKAMMGMIEPHNSTIPSPLGEVLLGELFNKVHKPTIAKVEGDVYAGGFLFLAGCNYVVALDHLKLGLPEVKKGIFPMQVMASLLRVMPPRKVIDWCMRGYNLPVETAAQWGLITHVVSTENMDSTVNGIIDDLKEGSPTAIRLGLEAFDHIQPNEAEHAYLMDMLKKAILSKDGQEGLKAFREKRKPEWGGG